MAYIPTNWANGDIVTSEKLNKAEQGIKNATVIPDDILVVEFYVSEVYDEQTEEYTYHVECAYSKNDLFNVDKHILGILSFTDSTVCRIMGVDENLRFSYSGINFLTSPYMADEYIIADFGNGWEYEYHYTEL